MPPPSSLLFSSLLFGPSKLGVAVSGAKTDIPEGGEPFGSGWKEHGPAIPLRRPAAPVRVAVEHDDDAGCLGQGRRER